MSVKYEEPIDELTLSVQLSLVTVSSPKIKVLHFVYKRDRIMDGQTDRQTDGQTIRLLDAPGDLSVIFTHKYQVTITNVILYT